MICIHTFETVAIFLVDFGCFAPSLLQHKLNDLRIDGQLTLYVF
jgi:hypothetical protein